jgi:probable F420-dependent oxidoreductase
MFVHGFTTEKYLRETTMPAIERGLAKSGRTRADIELSFPTLMITGETDEEYQKADAAVREQIAFYGSTPAYRPVLEAHGWGDVQDELNALSKRGEWKQMGKVITDDIVDAFAVRGSMSELASQVTARYGDLVDRVSFYTPYRTDPEQWTELVSAFKAQ